MWLPVACSVALGPAIALLFRIAHDAGHGCHFIGSRLNRLVCRLCLLPAYHPYSVWILLHNGRHHSFTNLRERDYIWIPLSKDEFESLTVFGRGLQRFYRTTLGVGVYYLCSIWAGMVLLRPSLVRKFKAAYLRDCVVVLAFFLAQLAWLAIDATAAEFAVRILLAIVLPFLVFNWLVGFASFLNHNHPDVPWFSRREDWSFYLGQVNCTVHIAVPKWMIFFLTDVGLHGTHHIDPRIPIWGLDRAEDLIVGDARTDIVADRWTFRRHREIMRACKLYDYDAHSWLDFAGRPTGAALLPVADNASNRVPAA
jgi:omega-6 fatty acid desaturase (delta-12 desaturase)